MIARIWRGRTRAEHADEYVAYVNETGVPAHRATPGNLGSMILRRDMDEEMEILVVSFWESMDAIRAFAGERPEVAKFELSGDQLESIEGTLWARTCSLTRR